MREIKNAIEFFENELMAGKCSYACVLCNANEQALIALREKQEREKNKNCKRSTCIDCSINQMDCVEYHKKLVSKYEKIALENAIKNDSLQVKNAKLAALDRVQQEIITELKAKANVVSGWINVKNRLPDKSKTWEKYIVTVIRSHFPTSTYDTCDSPYDEEIVTTAMYDGEQKLWHLDWDEVLNAMMNIDDSPLNGDYITHWQPLPEPPKESEDHA